MCVQKELEFAKSFHNKSVHSVHPLEQCRTTCPLAILWSVPSTTSVIVSGQYEVKSKVRNIPKSITRHIRCIRLVMQKNTHTLSTKSKKHKQFTAKASVGFSKAGKKGVVSENKELVSSIRVI